LEKQFHKYFFIHLHEMRLSDLIAIRQRNDESVPEYIQRFCDIKERYFAQEFKSLVRIIQRVSAHENSYHDSRGSRYQKKVGNVGSQESDSDEEGEVGLAEWTRSKKLVSCSWVKDNTEKYSFDVS
jgi:hypothetical protein